MGDEINGIPHTYDEISEFTHQQTSISIDSQKLLYWKVRNKNLAIKELGSEQQNLARETTTIGFEHQQEIKYVMLFKYQILPFFSNDVPPNQNRVSQP